MGKQQVCKRHRRNIIYTLILTNFNKFCCWFGNFENQWSMYLKKAFWLFAWNQLPGTSVLNRWHYRLVRQFLIQCHPKSANSVPLQIIIKLSACLFTLTFLLFCFTQDVAKFVLIVKNTMECLCQCLKMVDHAQCLTVIYTTVL